MKGATWEKRAARRRASKTEGREFYASCPAGFEQALAQEMRALGLWQVRPLKGRVAFAGSVADAELCCLWSHLASRVFAVLGRIGCADADELYEGTYRLPWEQILRPGSSLSVSASGVNGSLRNSRFSALRVKDAICDRLAEKTGARADVDLEHPDARLQLSIRDDRASLALDLSGEALFHRLPRAARREDSTLRVLRPDYAALLLEECGWAGACRDAIEAALDAEDGAAAGPSEQDGARPRLELLDECCAGGGAALEAAWMLGDFAPGLDRRRWGFLCWTEHRDDIWNELVAEARLRSERGAERAGLIGSMRVRDRNPSSVELARRVLHAGAPGIGVEPELVPEIDTETEAGDGTRSFVTADLTSTPLAQAQEVVARIARARLTHRAEGTAVLSREAPTLGFLGMHPRRDLLVLPDNEPARLQVWAAPSAADEREATSAPGNDAAATGTWSERGADPQASADGLRTLDLGDGSPVPVLSAGADQFAARLRKVARLRRKWAKRADVTCYRVYDADLPDYAAAIDLYQGSDATPGRWLVVAEYAAPKTIDPALARARFTDVLSIAPRVLEVDPSHVYARARVRSRGGSQYKQASSGAGTGGQGAAAERRLPLIREGGLTFAVNFDDYLDTGIFLDHRVTRNLVREHAKRARFFLNLFAYTGTASCYAADGGVEETVTVDLSNTYLDWAERNMELNGFTGRQHHYVRADVLSWIDEQIYRGNRWDLIFCDPPTFSNSAKMGRRTWDVQRDHVELLSRLGELLMPGGEAIFSCNLRSFRPNMDELERAGLQVEDITAQTIPEDFSRNQKIHRCYIVRRNE